MKKKYDRHEVQPLTFGKDAMASPEKVAMEGLWVMYKMLHNESLAESCRSTFRAAVRFVPEQGCYLFDDTWLRPGVAERLIAKRHLIYIGEGRHQGLRVLEYGFTTLGRSVATEFAHNGNAPLSTFLVPADDESFIHDTTHDRI